MRCPQCGYSLESEDRFCPGCGRALPDESGAQPAEPQPLPAEPRTLPDDPIDLLNLYGDTGLYGDANPYGNPYESPELSRLVNSADSTKSTNAGNAGNADNQTQIIKETGAKPEETGSKPEAVPATDPQSTTDPQSAPGLQSAPEAGSGIATASEPDTQTEQSTQTEPDLGQQTDDANPSSPMFNDIVNTAIFDPASMSKAGFNPILPNANVTEKFRAASQSQSQTPQPQDHAGTNAGFGNGEGNHTVSNTASPGGRLVASGNGEAFSGLPIWNVAEIEPRGADGGAAAADGNGTAAASRNGRFRLPLIAAIIALIVVALGVGAFMALRDNDSNPADQLVTVPMIQAEQADDAVRQLQDAGFTVKIRTEHSNLDKGAYVGLFGVESGERLAKGSTVTIIESLGPEETNPSPTETPSQTPSATPSQTTSTEPQSSEPVEPYSSGSQSSAPSSAPSSGTNSGTTNTTEANDPSVTPSSTFRTYTDAANGIRISLPSNFRQVAVTDAATQGRYIGSGIEVTTWSKSNAQGLSTSSELGVRKAAAGVPVAYELVAGPSLYVSYEKGGYIYYEREVVSNGRIVGVQLKYPTSIRGTGDPLTATIPPTLKNLG